MYQSETLDAVRDAAQQLTREGKVLSVGNPEFPLAVFADTYQVDDQPTNTELTQEEVVAVEDHFDEINQDSTPAVDDSREAIVNNLFTAISKIQFNTTNIIIPAVKAMHSKYANMQQAVQQAEYAVKSWRYLSPHDNPVLVNHINTRYTTVPLKESYTSYALNQINADAIIENMAINNPHLEQEEVTEWALQVGAERIEAVWHSLFGTPGPVIPTGLPYLSLQSAPFNVDDILVAYFICGHYMNNPEQVPGEDVDLGDWEHTMQCLHEMFGFYLMRAYLRRAENREDGLLILKNEAINAIETRRAVVVVNGDVFDPWIIGGGDFQAVLGAAIENNGASHLKHIVAQADKYIARWHAVYPMIKQAAIDFADRTCINNVIATFREVSQDELLKDRWSQDIELKLKDALRYLRRDDYENPYKVFSTLVCRVYFPEATYIEYLDAIDSFGQDFPKASIRELNTQATITLVAIFLAMQMAVEEFVPVIDENAEGSAFDDSGLLAVVGEVDEEEIEEVVVGDDTSDEVQVDESIDFETEESTDTDEVEETVDVEVTEPSSDDESDFGDDDSEPDPYADLDDGETEVEDETVDETEVEETEESTTEDEEDDVPLN